MFDISNLYVYLVTKNSTFTQINQRDTKNIFIFLYHLYPSYTEYHVYKLNFI